MEGRRGNKFGLRILKFVITFFTLVIQFMRKALATGHNVHFGKSQALVNTSKRSYFTVIIKTL